MAVDGGVVPMTYVAALPKVSPGSFATDQLALVRVLVLKPADAAGPRAPKKAQIQGMMFVSSFEFNDSEEMPPKCMNR